MSRTLRRIRSMFAAVVTPPDPSLVDAAFDGGYDLPDPQIADSGAAVRAGTRVDRVRWRRPDLVAALRADPGSPERELAAWPPVASRKVCRAA